MTDLRPPGQHADGLAHDLEATLAARRDLGEPYERALTEAFLARIESQIDARVDARVEETVGRRSAESQHHKQQLSLGIVSLALGIPITAVAGGVADGLPGVLVAWDRCSTRAAGNTSWRLGGHRRGEPRTRPARPTARNVLTPSRVVMDMAKLFTPVQVRSTTIRNRVWVAPMCQYSAVDGVPNDWHLVHLGSFARGGAGLVITEASAVSPEGRISPADAGIWNDTQRDAWARIVTFLRAQGATPGMQLAHAGRKASTRAPFDGRGSVPASEGGWESVAPSAVPYPGYDVPRELTGAEIDQVVEDFAAAARRALDAGFEVLEVHAAHGYLLHQFLSPLSNQRTDEYGGSFDNRVRLLLRVVEAVRAAVPESTPLLVRVSATDWVEGGWDADDTVALAKLLRDADVDLIDVSTGGNAPAEIPVEPGYQVDFARRVRTEADMPTGAVGLITEPKQAEEILVDGAADVVLLARAMLRDPHWALRAAHELGVPVGDGVDWPKQYLRASLG